MCSSLTRKQKVPSERAKKNMRDGGMMTMYRAINHPMLMLNFLAANSSGVCPAMTWAT